MSKLTSKIPKSIWGLVERWLALGTATDLGHSEFRIRVVVLLPFKATDITLLEHIAFPFLANQTIVAIKQIHSSHSTC